MTVKELIEKLQTVDGNKRVMTMGKGCMPRDLNGFDVIPKEQMMVWGLGWRKRW